MRILHLIQKSQLRGAEVFASQLSNHLLAKGHDVRLICLTQGDEPLPFQGTILSLGRPMSKRFMDVAGWRMLAREIKVFKPDIVQANAGDTLKFAVLSKLFFRWRVPIAFRNANKVSDFIDSWPKLMFNKLLMQRVNHVISVSELCRLDFIQTYGFNESRVTTVPIGIEVHPVMNPLPADLQHIFADGKVLVHVASFVPEKNHAGLLRMMQILYSKGENIKLIMIGDGKLRSAIQRQVETLKLAQHVFLLGYRNDVLAILRHASALVLPSKIEGLPGVILEAMYSHTPVIAYNVGGISEVVLPHETGFLIKAGDEAEFVNAILNVLHTQNIQIMKDNAHALVVNEYNNQRIADRFVSVYQKMLER